MAGASGQLMKHPLDHQLDALTQGLTTRETIKQTRAAHAILRRSCKMLDEVS
jgi:hypothetical protein